MLQFIFTQSIFFVAVLVASSAFHRENVRFIILSQLCFRHICTVFMATNAVCWHRNTHLTSSRLRRKPNAISTFFSSLESAQKNDEKTISLHLSVSTSSSEPGTRNTFNRISSQLLFSAWQNRVSVCGKTMRTANTIATRFPISLGCLHNSSRQLHFAVISIQFKSAHFVNEDFFFSCIYLRSTMFRALFRLTFRAENIRSKWWNVSENRIYFDGAWTEEDEDVD